MVSSDLMDPPDPARGERDWGAALSAHGADPIAAARPAGPPPKQKLYEKRKAVHNKRIDGPFRRFKWLVMLVTLAIYYATPWIRWDRGPYAPGSGGAGRPCEPPLLHVRHRDLAARILFCRRAAHHGRDRAVSCHERGRAARGAVMPARKRCGPTSSSMSTASIDGDRNARMRLDKAPWGPAKTRAARSVSGAVYLLISLADRRGLDIVLSRTRPRCSCRFLHRAGGAGRLHDRGHSYFHDLLARRVHA